MDDNSRDRLTLARRFVEPGNSTHRQYEALRAFFVEGAPSAEVATRFGYTPGSFRVLVHEFRNQPNRDFFIRAAGVGRPSGKQNRLRQQVIALRKQNLSVQDISRALARDGESLSPAAIAAILKADGTDYRVEASFEQMKTATGSDDRGCFVSSAYSSATRHALKNAESDRTWTMAWQSLARTGQPGVRAC